MGLTGVMKWAFPGGVIRSEQMDGLVVDCAVSLPPSYSLVVSILQAKISCTAQKTRHQQDLSSCYSIPEKPDAGVSTGVAWMMSSGQTIDVVGEPRENAEGQCGIDLQTIVEAVLGGSVGLQFHVAAAIEVDWAQGLNSGFRGNVRWFYTSVGRNERIGGRQRWCDGEECTYVVRIKKWAANNTVARSAN